MAVCLIYNLPLGFLQLFELKISMQKGAIMIAILVMMVIRSDSHYLPINRLKKNLTDTAATQINAVTNNNSTLAFSNVQDLVYYIYLEVGTPSQTMGVQFDTGSNILWLPTQQAHTSGYFNTSKSSTFTNTSKPGSIQYADGSGVSGTYGTDILAITGTPINITATYLWVTQEVDMNFPSQIQGLVGMGYTTTPNFLDIAYSQNEIKSPVFTLQIEQTTSQSYIYYNEIPEWITNTTTFEPVVDNEYWQVSTIGVTVGGIDMTSFAANIAIIDSGTSLFYLNQALFNNIVTQFFQQCNNALSTPECPCSINWPTLAFMFTGIETYIYPSQYVESLTNSICTYNFGTLGTVQQILLGDTFFRGYIITFDKINSQIGFKGDLGVVKNVFPSASVLYGQVMMGLAGFIILLGAIAYCSLERLMPQRDKDIMEMQFTISNYTPSISNKRKLNRVLM